MRQAVNRRVIATVGVAIAATTWPLSIALVVLPWIFRQSLTVIEVRVGWILTVLTAMAGTAIPYSRTEALAVQLTLRGAAMGVVVGAGLVTLHEYVHMRPWQWVIIGGLFWSAIPGGIVGGSFGISAALMAKYTNSDSANLPEVLMAVGGFVIAHSLIGLTIALVLDQRRFYIVSMCGVGLLLVGGAALFWTKSTTTRSRS